MSNASLEALLGKEHADITYLRQESISLVISKALSETYKHQPIDPVAFFSKYLLNHVNVMALNEKVTAKTITALGCQSKHQSQGTERSPYSLKLRNGIVK